jgi:hypothetical protein
MRMRIRKCVRRTDAAVIDGRAIEAKSGTAAGNNNNSGKTNNKNAKTNNNFTTTGSIQSNPIQDHNTMK